MLHDMHIASDWQLIGAKDRAISVNIKVKDSFKMRCVNFKKVKTCNFIFLIELVSSQLHSTIITLIHNSFQNISRSKQALS